MKIINNQNMSHRNWINAVSNDQLRPVMTGVYFDLVSEKMVATNSHLLISVPLEVEWNKEEELLSNEERLKILQEKSKIVPVELFDSRKYMGEPKYYAFQVHFDFDDPNYARVFNGPEMVFRCRYIDGVFPNYQAIIPKNTECIDSIGIDFNMIEKIFKALPTKDKSLKFIFAGKNKSVRFSNNQGIEGVVMPTIGL